MKKITLTALALAACAAGPSRAPAFGASPSPPAAAAPVLEPMLRVLHLADFGVATPQQASVTRGMVRSNRRAPFDLVLSAGDNVYPQGPDPDLPGAERCSFDADGATVPAGYAPPADASFEEAFEKPLRQLASAEDGRPLPVYVALGNHDVTTKGEHGRGTDSAATARRKACLEVAHRSPQWQMPGRRYVIDRGPARFIVIDSNLLAGDYGGFTFDAELEFFRAATAGCAGRYCFLVSHHPPASVGQHGGESARDRYRSRVERLEAAAQGRVAAWLSGHEHDLQHLRTRSGSDVFISGNGAKGRPEERLEGVPAGRARLLFASSSWGYGRLEVSPEGWTYRFEDDASAPIHCCAARGAGPCEPVKCG